MKRNIYIQQPNIKNLPHICKEKGKKEKKKERKNSGSKLITPPRSVSTKQIQNHSSVSTQKQFKLTNSSVSTQKHITKI